MLIYECRMVIDIHDALCYKVANDAMRHDCTRY
jgi:hypothetical protein